MVTTSDRVCPEHGDIGATPSTNFCPTCGKGLVMEGLFRSAGKNMVQGAAIGLGLGAGLEAGSTLVGNAIEGLGDFFS